MNIKAIMFIIATIGVAFSIIMVLIKPNPSKRLACFVYFVLFISAVLLISSLDMLKITFSPQ